MPFPTCNHRKDDGIPCGSPSLRGRKLCYYHQRDHRRRQYAARVLRQLDPLSPEAPLPQTLPDVQVALYAVLNAIVDSRIPSWRASRLLFSMQQASASIRKRHLN